MFSRAARLVAGIVALVVVIGLFTVPQTADAEGGNGQPPALLDGPAAVVEALKTGEPVIASALTDEHTLVTADPGTGLLVAELSAGVARVSDGRGGWREPSARLVPGPDGVWQAEAAAVPVTVSGGAGAFVTLGDSGDSVRFSWPGVLPTPVIEGELATFGDVAPGVDLVVRAAVDGAESYLVVKDAAAADSPLVRQLPITVTGDGVQAVVSEGGTVAYVDGDGLQRFWIPPAYVWDSSGQPEGASLAELLEPAEGARIDELPAVANRQSRAVERVTYGVGASSVSDILDDPATVYPVVIDPSIAGSQSYAVRVTQTFTKFNSDIGSRGKIGYNGWTSPYYKSRMYHQFKWPTINGDPVAASRINSAEFSYVQTHSPQHSCTDTGFGPAVKVQFHYVISSSTTWSNQPGVHPNIGSVSNDYAVGHQDVCGKTYTQKWNVSSMVKKERTTYDTRTTVTVGIRSADESDKNGWREYKYSSAKLVLTFQSAPVVPAAPAFSPAAATGVTSTLTPTLSAKVALQAGDKCVTTNCLRADFEVTKPGGSKVTLAGSSVANGGTSRVTVPAGTLVDLSRYSVKARARSVDSTTSAWGAATTIDVRLNVAPPLPVVAEVLDETGRVVPSGSPITAGARFSVRAKLPSGTLCTAEVPGCLNTEFTIKQGTVTKYGPTVVTGKRPGDLVASPAIEVGTLEGTVTLSVRVAKSWSPTVWTAAKTLDFAVRIAPNKPTLTVPDRSSRVIPVEVLVPGARFSSYTYHWKAVYASLFDSSDPVTFTGSLTGPASGTVRVVLPIPDSDLGAVSALTMWVETPGHMVSPETTTGAIAIVSGGVS